MAKEMQVPFAEVAPVFWNHPDRFNLYLDLVHFNCKGHHVLADYRYQTIDKLAWWD
ncbi:hypothetical protein [Syntrophomonas wolfei]|uniref:hypothetical protein n=1 Tax=Syntrophomonas wolfei TaxID=863 RepID=UPI0012DC2D27|nr:hypothetical protein [Syntrophomonas wolfei]